MTHLLKTKTIITQLLLPQTSVIDYIEDDARIFQVGKILLSSVSFAFSEQKSGIRIKKP